MTKINGKWHYRSYSFSQRAEPSLSPWAPLAVMELVTDASGNVTGTSKLGPIESKISGSVKPPSGASGTSPAIPEGIELEVTVPVTAEARYKLQGFFLEESDHIVGTVVAISNDLGHQPDGTSGPFALYPVKS